MNNQAEIPPIDLPSLALAFVPVVVVLAVLFRWRLGGATELYAVFRMLLQLLLIGFVLDGIFQADQAAIVVVVLAVMLCVSAWIALRPLRGRRLALYGKALGAIAVGGGTTLWLVTQTVLRLEPWFTPRIVVPLGGMIFFNSMNMLSLVGERLFMERDRGATFVEARRFAMNAALIPQVNALMAVGLVSIPGMMAGQILGGVSPLVAARYQIMVMCMVFGSAGITAIIFLKWIEPTDDSVADSPQRK